MTPEEVLQQVLSRLDQCGIAHMITGSFASNAHGVPRATYDADVVIESDRQSLETFLESLRSEFYASPEAAKEALARRHMFNIVHLATGLKVDFIIRKARPFSEEEFRRRRQVAFLGALHWFATPEDVILSKLEWSKAGSSERQFADAVGVARVQRDSLDWTYLSKWAEALGVRELLDRLTGEMA
jgi:hypothetical protein